MLLLNTASALLFDHDAELQACARGEAAALQRIYEQESRYLLGVALRIVRDRATAEDVLHVHSLRFGAAQPALTPSVALAKAGFTP